MFCVHCLIASTNEFMKLVCFSPFLSFLIPPSLISHLNDTLRSHSKHTCTNEHSDTSHTPIHLHTNHLFFPSCTQTHTHVTVYSWLHPYTLISCNLSRNCSPTANLYHNLFFFYPPLERDIPIMRLCKLIRVPTTWVIPRLHTNAHAHLWWPYPPHFLLALINLTIHSSSAPHRRLRPAEWNLI